MKTTLFTLLLLFLLGSCSNEDTANSMDNSTGQESLIGQWVWISTTGGILGGTETPESTGATRSLTITSTSIQNYFDGELISETDYTFETQTSLLFNESREMLIQTNGIRQIVELSNEQLILIGDCFDCVTSTYIPSNN